MRDALITHTHIISLIKFWFAKSDLYITQTQWKKKKKDWDFCVVENCSLLNSSYCYVITDHVHRLNEPKKKDTHENKTTSHHQFMTWKMQFINISLGAVAVLVCLRFRLYFFSLFVVFVVHLHRFFEVV